MEARHDGFADPVTCQIVGFLREIGIEVIAAELPRVSFLPGVTIERGRLLVDEGRLLYPGDLLHEAGHLAVVPRRVRPHLSDDFIAPEVESQVDMNTLEVTAIAWSYAAILHLQLDPRILFHGGGYQGRSENLLLTYGVGAYPGAAGLQAAGLAVTGEAARQMELAPYPHMLKWLRD